MLTRPFPKDATVAELFATLPASLEVLGRLGYRSPGCASCSTATIGELVAAKGADLEALLAELRACPEPAGRAVRPFTRETPVGDIVRWFPAAVPLLERFGFHGKDCLVCTPDTLADAARKRNADLAILLADLEDVPEPKTRVTAPYGKDVVIAEVFQRCPEAFRVFQQLGYKCFDCIVCYTDTLEVAAQLHRKELQPLLDALSALSAIPRPVTRPYARSARVRDIFQDSPDTLEVLGKLDYHWGDCASCARDGIGEIAEKKKASLTGLLDDLNRLPDPPGSARPPWTAATPAAAMMREFPATAEPLARLGLDRRTCPRCSDETLEAAAARAGASLEGTLADLHALPRSRAMTVLDPGRLVGQVLEEVPGAGEALAKLGYACAGCVVRTQDTLQMAARLHEKNLELLLDSLAALLPAEQAKTAVAAATDPASPAATVPVPSPSPLGP
ncbi:MAG: hypothetical protein HYZ53_28985 [Planctomycetes bacterium]|nr:hypothetical protein [Planctomycetota bacterium]